MPYYLGHLIAYRNVSIRSFLAAAEAGMTEKIKPIPVDTLIAKKTVENSIEIGISMMDPMIYAKLMPTIIMFRFNS